MTSRDFEENEIQESMLTANSLIAGSHAIQK
jgi:hypothetical protein